MRIIFRVLVATAVLDFLRRVCSLSWLTGPIFDKELRVSSRRRRNYVLRFAYLGLLTVFLVLVWVATVGYRGRGTAVYQVSRMAEAGKAIVACVVWFQFCATQIVAVIMLSTAISDEIYNRTLGVLMTTPMSSFQIVMGKLLSKLLQLILLLAISLPLLAIVRVFGGVPWDYLISSLCITMTTIIFVGSLSLFFSIFTRRAYIVIIGAVMTLGVLFALLPFLGGMCWHAMDLDELVPETALLSVLLFPNPYGNLFFNTMMMVQPRAPVAGMPVIYWPLHCGLMLAASAVVLLLAVIRVRKAALRQAAGEPGASAWRLFAIRATPASADKQDCGGKIRPVAGCPIIWKELKHPMFGRHKIAMVLAAFVCLSLLFTTYLLCSIEGMLHNQGTHIVYAVVLLGVGMLFTIVLTATCIASEKESRSWPLLLATTLEDRDILVGKFLGTVRRCLPAWLLLLGHVGLFSIMGCIHPIAVLQIGISAAWIVTFLCGTGLYFSSRFKHTTTAVIMNFALAATLWAIVPLLMGITAGITRQSDHLVEACMNLNPFVQAAVIMDATARVGPVGNYDWIGVGRMPVDESTVLILIYMVAYMAVGLLFAWRAMCRFRRNIF